MSREESARRSISLTAEPSKGRSASSSSFVAAAGEGLSVATRVDIAQADTSRTDAQPAEVAHANAAHADAAHADTAHADAAHADAAHADAAHASASVAARAHTRGESSKVIALHRSARRWLDACVNRSAPLLDARLPSSEYWRERRFYRLYQHQHCVLSRYAPAATSVLDVGSALPPFVNTLDWVRRRAILGPRFAGNVAKNGSDLFTIERIRSKFHVEAIQADFLEWTPPGWTAPDQHRRRAAPAYQAPPFDLVLCSEVVEHIDAPREFVRKLLAVGSIVVLSVPYKWAGCDNTRCHHKQNHITRDKIAAWAGRRPLAYDIVQEASGEKRIICIYRHEA